MPRCLSFFLTAACPFALGIQRNLMFPFTSFDPSAFQIDSSPLDEPLPPDDPPTVAESGSVDFSGQEQPVAVSVNGVIELMLTTTTPSPFIPITVNLSFTPVPFLSDLAKVDPTIDISSLIEDNPNHKILAAYIKEKTSI
jgi:hypothetical protein